MKVRCDGLIMNTPHARVHVWFPLRVSRGQSVTGTGSYCTLGYEVARGTETRAPQINGVEEKENKQEVSRAQLVAPKCHVEIRSSRPKGVSRPWGQKMSIPDNQGHS